jgi:2,4-dienoyl-CoA reductase-like NADH-dependent reductase (Old Yellow Enzyme family)
MYDVTPLFTPLQVKHKTLRNRIVMPPMVVNRGLTTPEGWEWYGRRAAGGVALVIVEASDVVRFGSAYTAENLRPLVEAIHQGGALAAIQLFPGVRGQAVSPAQLTHQELQQLLAHYRTAADVCAGAGFDGVEPHGAHGFLLNQFFSPVQNRRTGEYGGATSAGRMRLALDVVGTIYPVAREAGMLMLYRHTPVGPGYGVDESLALATELVKAGVDVLDISPASDAAPGDRAAPFVRLGAPVIAVNELDRLERALEVLREQRATLVAVGRGLIADPDWPTKVRAGRLEEIVACTGCDQCFADLDRGAPVGCSQWDVQMNE